MPFARAHQRHLTPFALAIIGLYPLAAWSAPEAPTQLPEVVVRGHSEPNPVGLEKISSTASRLGLSVRETPATITIVDRELLDERGIETTQEALKSVPGVTTSSAPGSPGSVLYRGFSGGSVTQLFNGITVQYDVIAARPVDSWIYERVEAIGGPSTFMYGAGAVGGSINYITKTANRDGDMSEFKAAYGSYQANQVAAGTNRQLGEQHFLRLDVNRNAMDGWSDGTKREAWQLAGSWLWDLTPALSHTLAVEYQNEQVDRAYWGTPLRRPVAGQIAIDEGTRFKNYNAPDGIYEQTVRWTRSVLEYKASDNLRLRNTAYHYDALRDYQNVETYAFNATNTAVTRSNALLQRHDQELNGNRFEFNLDSQLGSLPSAWAGGLDYSVNKQTRFPRSVAGPFDTVDPYNFSLANFFSLPGMSQIYTPQRTNKVTTLALFLENRTRLSDRLSVLSGLRYDEIDLEVTNHGAVSASNPAYFKRTYKPLTGRLAMAYDLTPNANVYVQYSTAADPPAGILTTASFSQVRDFDLTTGKQWEVGSKFSFADGRGAGTVAYYDITRKNIAITDPNNPGTTIPVGQQSSRGIELSVAYRIAAGLQVAGNISQVDAEYDEFNESVGGIAVSRAGKRPSNIPERVGNLWLTYVPAANWQIGADARYVASRYSDSANTISDGAYNLFGAFVSYRLNRTSKLTLRGKNLSDEIYAENLSGSNMAYLGAPRTFDISIQTGF
ncbi:MAG: TonB-dependent siderophore receptor [Betaproteobacteria bacterium HGW-Betaproteobacteria-10]|nr:MAG: TonB-dependent siderophore receptor [Betaproteobacteria bacterium HGW-Betaproteobacteria-10]